MDKPPLWDSFQDPPSKKVSGSAANWSKMSLFLKLFKLFTYLLVFFIITVTAVASKLIYLFMAAQLKKDKYEIKICQISGKFN